MQINRKKMVEELRLRRLIRQAITIVENKRSQNETDREQEEEKLRYIIRDLIAEGDVPDPQDSPHASTGINVLEDLLKKIIPVIEIDYKKMTTSSDQRRSYRTHMLKAVTNTLAPVKANDEAGELQEQDIKIDVKDEDPAFSMCVR
jgi:hypothetical protein